ncbi:MAG: exodeoxyribonuclease VII small subunit [Bacteroidaceae bacterium]|nr:exodeoxyribonuclease VII small subunit [Bacteroidaceae bacterium]
MKKKITYAEAMQALESIVEGLENNTLGVDELTAQLEQAQQLMSFCKQKLTLTSAEIEKILNDETSK